jgi:hypothetical protein
MAQILSAFSRDANGVPITTDGIVVSKSITYAASTTGAQASSTLYTVTGDVLLHFFAVCGTSLDSDGSPTIEVGISGNTAALLALTNGKDIDAGEVWIDTVPATIEAMPATQILTGGADILQEIKTATVKAGVLTYYCIWRPLSSDGNVVAA